MVTNPVTIELPNGKTHALSIAGVVKVLKHLSSAGQALGQSLILTVRTTTAPAPEEERTPRTDVRKVMKPAAAVPRRSAPRRKQRPFDVKKLERAMRTPGFKPLAYAKQAGVSSSLIYYHQKALAARQKKTAK